jgi:hypothetical protein
MARVKYIGTKPQGRADTVAGTGVVWAEPGDVQEVADPKAVILLLRHKDVWQLETPIAAAAKPAELPVSTEPAESKPAKPAKAEAPAEPAPAKGKGGKKKAAPEPSAEPKYVLEGEGGVEFVLDTMDDAQLAAFGKDFELTWQADLTGDALRAALYEAATAEPPAATEGAASAEQKA